MNFLTENKIEYYSELESKIADIMTAHDAAAKALRKWNSVCLICRCLSSTPPHTDS